MNVLKNEVLPYMEQEISGITPTQDRLRRYLLEHVVDVGYMSLRELAENARVSEVSVLNFCRLMGFESYIALREAFRAYTRFRAEAAGGLPLASAPVPGQCDMLGPYCLQLMRHHHEMLENIDPRDLDRCARTILASDNILVLGHDVSKIAADYLSSRLNYLHLHSRSVNLGDRDTVQVLLSDLSERDSVVVFSFPPYYQPAGDVAEYARLCGAALIAVADSADSPVVGDYGRLFFCRTRNPYFFNWMSVPIHFAEVLTYCVSTIMGEKGEELVRSFNDMGDR